MNLRMDKNSIRVRLSQNEFESLLNDQVLSESLPLIQASLIVKPSHMVGASLTMTKVITKTTEQVFEMLVPFDFLKASAEKIPPATIELSSFLGKEDCKVESNEEKVVLLFEVDRFSRKNKL